MRRTLQVVPLRFDPCQLPAHLPELPPDLDQLSPEPRRVQSELLPMSLEVGFDHINHVLGSGSSSGVLESLSDRDVDAGLREHPREHVSLPDVHRELNLLLLELGLQCLVEGLSLLHRERDLGGVVLVASSSGLVSLHLVCEPPGESDELLVIGDELRDGLVANEIPRHDRLSVVSLKLLLVLELVPKGGVVLDGELTVESDILAGEVRVVSLEFGNDGLDVLDLGLQTRDEVFLSLLLSREGGNLASLLVGDLPDMVVLLALLFEDGGLHRARGSQRRWDDATRVELRSLKTHPLLDVLHDLSQTLFKPARLLLLPSEVVLQLDVLDVNV